MTPLDEWSVRRRALYVTTHNTQNRQTSMLSALFEPTISASRRLQTHALDRTATGIACCFSTYSFFATFWIIVYPPLAAGCPLHMTRETEIIVSLHNQIINPTTLQCETMSGSRCGLMERSTDHGRKYAAFISDRIALWTQRMWSSQKRTLFLAFTYTYLYSTETLLKPLIDLFWPRSDISCF